MQGAPEFGKVVIFGVGLIGGSFALALKAAGQVEEVVGFGRSLSSLTQALDLGIIDRVGDRKSTRLNSSHSAKSRMPSSA